MTTLLDTTLDDDIRLVIMHVNNIYALHYINLYYEHNLYFNSINYNNIHDEYIKIYNNFSILQDLDESEFLNWVASN